MTLLAQVQALVTALTSVITLTGQAQTALANFKTFLEAV